MLKSAHDPTFECGEETGFKSAHSANCSGGKEKQLNCFGAKDL